VSQQQTVAGRWPLWPICPVAFLQAALFAALRTAAADGLAGRNEQMFAGLVK